MNHGDFCISLPALFTFLHNWFLKSFLFSFKHGLHYLLPYSQQMTPLRRIKNHKGKPSNVLFNCHIYLHLSPSIPLLSCCNQTSDLHLLSICCYCFSGAFLLLPKDQSPMSPSHNHQLALHWMDAICT